MKIRFMKLCVRKWRESQGRGDTESLRICLEMAHSKDREREREMACSVKGMQSYVIMRSYILPIKLSEIKIKDNTKLCKEYRGHRSSLYTGNGVISTTLLKGNV